MHSKYVCPKCKRPMYTRRNKKCQFCGEDLPEELLLTKEEIEKHDKQKKKDLESLDEYKESLNDWSPYSGF